MAEIQRDFYDRLWAKVGSDELNHHERARMQRISEELDQHLPGGRGELEVLEVGCGRGWLSGLVLAARGHVRALDLSPASIAKARAAFPSVDFDAGDVFDADLDERFYDLIVASEVIEHVTEKSRFVGVLARLMKPGGLIIFTTPNARHFDRWREIARFQQPVEEWVTPQQMRELLAPYFQILTCTTFFFEPEYLGRVLGNRVAQAAINRNDRLARFAGRRGLGLYGVTVARRLS